jgi:hypothetical protein
VATLTFKFPADHASANLNARIAEFKKRDQYVKLDPFLAAVHFLRGVSSLASQVLPTFYFQLGSRLPQSAGLPHWQRVQAAVIEHSSLQSISLCCRSAFCASEGQLTGRRFANTPDAILAKVAEFWAKKADREVADASMALTLLREIFRRCAHSRAALLTRHSLLERRIGLIAYHADRRAAHLTLESFYFSIVDLVHVVAAIAVIGAIIIDFDYPKLGSRYFDEIDLAGWQAAQQVFPNLSHPRLFQHFEVHKQAKVYWKVPESGGLDAILDRLTGAIGYSEDATDAET